jgi:hypothetical protein
VHLVARAFVAWRRRSRHDAKPPGAVVQVEAPAPAVNEARGVAIALHPL